MNSQFVLKLETKMPAETGVGKNGAWKKQNYIFHVTGKPSHKICMVLWGEHPELEEFQVNENYRVDFEILSRSYQGKWYTDVILNSMQRLPNTEEDDLPDFLKESNSNDDLF